MEMPHHDGEKVIIKPYSLKELAVIYDVNKKTFLRWTVPFAEEIGERQGRYYTAKQVRIIFEKLGLPGPVKL